MWRNTSSPSQGNFKKRFVGTTGGAVPPSPFGGARPRKAPMSMFMSDSVASAGAVRLPSAPTASPGGDAKMASSSACEICSGRQHLLV
ncbi:hypothetical protein STCU_11325 [Strigomonas culicis]|uniref:Uncharacterized protein n=1 Tax=Strigomonas culicis TaxID=28005 RepID=S9V0Q6_9TRYP|nr:hypothetical protein STCU_11325 [Strigomonas culicis]|eukprot:EPY16390.1 hypothetical protein STCU_11325 [Strigomonas culicis]